MNKRIRVPGRMARFSVVVAGIGLLSAVSACAGGTTQAVSVMTPAALVSESAHTTLAEKTADITLTGTISAAGQHIPMNGDGVADFTTHAVSATISASIQGMNMHLKELMVDGQVYMGGTMGPVSFSELTGKDWVSLPVSSSANQNLFGSDPLAQLQLLEQQGSTVTPIGKKTIDGHTATGYTIVPSRDAMVKGAQKIISQMGLDPSEASQIQSRIAQMQPPTLTAWFDSSHLLREISVDLNMGGGLGVSGSVVMDFTHYGVPVNVTAPPSSDVVSFQQFLQDAHQAGSSGS